MSSVDPRRLIPALEDYEQELRQWMDLTLSTTGDAEYTHRYGVESLEQVSHRLAVEASRADQDAQHVRQVRAQHTTFVETAAATLVEANHSYIMASQAVQEAQHAVVRWETALHAAEQHLKAARIHLQETQRELRDAESRLFQAYAFLRQAESALESCRSDSRNNCNAQASDVNTASTAVRHCEAAVTEAKAEVQRAERIVWDAERRVERCLYALGFARQADDLAQQTLPVAADAISQAEHALESLKVAGKHLSEAEVWVEEQQSEVNAGKMHLHHGVERLDTATQNLRNFHGHADESGNYNQQARRELQHRQDALRELNRPDLSLP